MVPISKLCNVARDHNSCMKAVALICTFDYLFATPMCYAIKKQCYAIKLRCYAIKDSEGLARATFGRISHRFSDPYTVMLYGIWK